MKTKVTEYNIRLLSHKDQVRFALFCAKQVEQIKPEAINCIRVVEKWLDGKATAEECKQVYTAYYATTNATYATTNATNYAAYTAANAATYAANAAANAATAATYATNAATYAANAAATTAATKQDVVRQQEVYLYELLHIDDIVEKELLGGE